MIHGILNVYKEAGFTSFDVVAKLRGITKQKKIGHTGTLDPAAEGVLPVCFGNGTKLCEILTDKIKEYEAVFLLGVATDTLDMTGTILEEKEVTVSEEQVLQALEGFVGTYGQIPPMYSAIKIDGKRLYELAREGKVVERKAREVTIYELEALEISLPRIKVRVKCSKGTYIRSLGRDIGEFLGCGASMERLVRTVSGDFVLSEAIKFSEIESLSREGRLEEKILPVEAVLTKYPALHVKEAFKKRIDNGNSLPEEAFGEKVENAEGKYRIYNAEGKFFALYRYSTERKEWLPDTIFPLSDS